MVLHDRQHLAESGIVIVTLAVDAATKYICSGPEIVSRGFVYEKEAEELLAGADEVVQKTLDKCFTGSGLDLPKMRANIKDSLGDYFWKKTKRRPMILPMILEV